MKKLIAIYGMLVALTLAPLAIHAQTAAATNEVAAATNAVAAAATRARWRPARAFWGPPLVRSRAAAHTRHGAACGELASRHAPAVAATARAARCRLAGGAFVSAAPPPKQSDVQLGVYRQVRMPGRHMSRLRRIA